MGKDILQLEDGSEELPVMKETVSWIGILILLMWNGDII